MKGLMISDGSGQNDLHCIALLHCRFVTSWLMVTCPHNILGLGMAACQERAGRSKANQLGDRVCDPKATGNR